MRAAHFLTFRSGNRFAWGVSFFAIVSGPDSDEVASCRFIRRAPDVSFALRVSLPCPGGRKPGGGGGVSQKRSEKSSRVFSQVAPHFLFPSNMTYVSMYRRKELRSRQHMLIYNEISIYFFCLIRIFTLWGRAHAFHAFKRRG